MKCHLFTGDREVCPAFFIPPFKDPPDVLMWGERVFWREPDVSAVEKDGGTVFRYKEAFTYFVATGPDGLPFAFGAASRLSCPNEQRSVF